MSAAKERLAVGQLFRATWDETLYPVAYPNKDFDPPENGIWARIVIQAADSSRIELGGQVAHRRTVGLLVVQLFAPVNSGDGDVLELAETAAAIFRDQRVTLDGGTGDMLFREPTVRPVGSNAQDNDDATYYQVNVNIPYQRGNI